MDYAGFIHFVRRAAQLDDTRARRALQAVLETLAERIAPGTARDLAAALPPELAAWVTTAARVEGLDLDEFLRRVAKRAEVDVDTAERYAEAVFAALGQALGPDVITDLTADLPADFDRLLPRGRWVEVVETERFLRRVAERGALDLDDLEPAWRATEAVLETLAERIAGGEVDDLLERLPLSCARRSSVAAAGPAAGRRACRSTSSSGASPSARAPIRLPPATTSALCSSPCARRSATTSSST